MIEEIRCEYEAKHLWKAGRALLYRQTQRSVTIEEWCYKAGWVRFWRTSIKDWQKRLLERMKK